LRDNSNSGVIPQQNSLTIVGYVQLISLERV